MALAAARIDVSLSDRFALVRVDGYVSGPTEAELAPALDRAASCPRIAVVFSEASLINSAGTAVLLDLLLRLRESGHEVRVAHPAAHFRRAFRITGLALEVPVFESVEAATADW